MPHLSFLSAPLPPLRPLLTLWLVPFPQIILSRTDLGLLASRPRSLSLPVTAPHPTLSTIPILLSDPQVHPSYLWSTQSYIAPQLLDLTFMLHRTFSPSSGSANNLQSRPPFCLWPPIHRPYTQALLSGIPHSCQRSLVTADHPVGDPPSTACLYQDCGGYLLLMGGVDGKGELRLQYPPQRGQWHQVLWHFSLHLPHCQFHQEKPL